MVTVLPQLTKIKGAALDFLFPQFCVGCGKEGSYICESCSASLAFISRDICRKCGIPRPFVPETFDEADMLCPGCAEWESSIDGIRSVFKFEGVVRSAVHQLKYKNLRAVAPILAAYLSDYLDNNHVPCDVLVPVPLHTRRIRERGYNQSVLLVDELHKLTGLPVEKQTLVKTRQNVPQAKTQSVEERRDNIIGVFSCRNDDLSGKQVLLVDDVTTSGSTLDACAQALKKVGALSVWGLTLAREI